MHELPVTESILKVILKHAAANHVNKVVSIRLEIGKLCDLEDEWIQKYFDHLSKGTIAEGAVLKIDRMPVVMMCGACSKPYEVDVEAMKEMACPRCGEAGGTLLSGKEYYIKDMEVQ